MMPRPTTRKRTMANAKPANSPQLLKADTSSKPDPDVHVFGNGFRCDTETRGHATPQGRSPLEIVVDASEGFIPLWKKDTTLRWQYRESSFEGFEDHRAAKAAVE